MKSGIYAFVTDRGYAYIGSATALAIRRSSHLSTLRRGLHPNRSLQRAWDKYGEQTFRFRVLIICRPSELLLFEQRALDAFKPRYNILKIAGTSYGLKHTQASKLLMKKHIRTEEHARKIGLANRGNTSHKGKAQSPETKARIAAKLRGRRLSAATRAKMSASWYPRGALKKGT
jgi:group I intron endonuclease